MKKISIRIAIIIIVVLSWFLYQYSNKQVFLKETISIIKGDSFDAFFREMSRLDQILLKSYLKLEHSKMPPLQLGTYQFKGYYNKKDFFDTIAKGPIQEYTKIKILEGRSIYDIDNMLRLKGYIKENEYVAMATDPIQIKKMVGSFPFLSKFGSLTTLEGFLYPDTYFIDPTKDVLNQLFQLQIKNFVEKIEPLFEKKYSLFLQSLKKSLGINEFSYIDVLKIASIVEKEERSSDARPAVAGVFFNRIKDGMQLDADITLCYGLKKGYEECTPSVIVANLTDKKNVFNTRQLGGLTPTPIVSPTVNAIQSVLEYNVHEYYYYLHDRNGVIYFGKNIQEHNDNKSKYLNNN